MRTHLRWRIAMLCRNTAAHYLELPFIAFREVGEKIEVMSASSGVHSFLVTGCQTPPAPRHRNPNA
jgi:hypothetical protein